MISFVYIDAETKPITPVEPHPEPVSVGIGDDSGVMLYGFGHPENTDEERETARGFFLDLLREIYRDDDVWFVGHNIWFDIGVLCRFTNLPPEPFRRKCIDTLFVAYLLDPYAPSFGLKPFCVRHKIGNAEDRGAETGLQTLVMERFGLKKLPKEWKVYIHRLPFADVRPYLMADVRLCRALHERSLEESFVPLLPALERELELAPILLKMEERGVPVDRDYIAKTALDLDAVNSDMEGLIRERLGGTTINLKSGAQLLEALEDVGLIDETTELPLTKKTKKRSTRFRDLAAVLPDDDLKEAFGYFRQGHTYRNTFIENWLYKDRVHIRWNQTRNLDARGTKTGRFSSTPNLQNIPKKMADGFPNIRAAIVAEPGQVLCVRDYSQQEFRILAHFEDGLLKKAYLDDPGLDVHAFVQLLFAGAGYHLDRDDTKRLGFGLLYGMGARGLALRLGCSEEEARDIIDAYYRFLPGILALRTDLERKARRGQPFWTIGGRRYTCEPSRKEEDEFGNIVVKSFEYRMINTLIQGSAADVTKEAMRRLEQRHMKERFGATMLLSVHDEIVCSAPLSQVEEFMPFMRETMEIEWCTIPLLSDGKIGDNFGQLIAWED